MVQCFLGSRWHLCMYLPLLYFSSDVPFRILCPNSICGRIIGKQGNVIKVFMEKTGTNIVVSRYGKTSIFFSILDINLRKRFWSLIVFASLLGSEFCFLPFFLSAIGAWKTKKNFSLFFCNFAFFGVCLLLCWSYLH